MSFMQKARKALSIGRKPRQAPPESLEEFNNIIVQFKQQAPDGTAAGGCLAGSRAAII